VIGHMALHKQDAAVGVQSGGHQQIRHPYRVRAKNCWVLRNRYRMQIDHAVDDIMLFLHAHPVADRAQVIPQMGIAGWLNSTEYSLRRHAPRRVVAGEGSSTGIFFLDGEAAAGQAGPMSYETITYDVSDGVGYLHLNRPEGANAVCQAFAADLRAVMLEIEFDDNVRAVAVTAEGKVFCAGGDLKEFHSKGADLPKHAASLLADFHVALYKMNRMPKPFVAGVRGAAGGAGLSFVGAFDLVISGESSKYTMAYTRAGMTPDGTSSYFIGRHIGLRRMLDLTLTNRVLDAETAEAWGLVNRVVADDDVAEATRAMAVELAAGAPFAVGHAKQVIYNGFEQPLEAAGEFEGAMITAAMATADGQEGIASFVEKRAPNWTGS